MSLITNKKTELRWRQPCNIEDLRQLVSELNISIDAVEDVSI